MGSDMTKLRREWGRKKTVLGGTSMGAAVSLYAAMEDPDGVAGLILATPPTCYEGRQKFVPMYRESAEMAKLQGLEAAKAAAAKKAKPPIFLESEQGRAQFDIGWLQKFDMGVDGYAAAMQCAEASDLPTPKELSQLNIPTLILAWRSDVQHPLETARMLAKTLPDAELVVANTWDEIETFTSHKRRFIQGLMGKAS
mmetsp:Transcript_66261/g.170603  ORF Transcript_66261/g.170603 Transcript_66261/m.170603 type:complete len:197 (+) Transcript_66261:1-591(+)